MVQELLNLIGQTDGSAILFDTWAQNARSAGLRPDLIQSLKRQGLVHTRLNAQGQNEIVRGAKPAQ